MNTHTSTIRATAQRLIKDAKADLFWVVVLTAGAATNVYVLASTSYLRIALSMILLFSCNLLLLGWHLSAVAYAVTDTNELARQAEQRRAEWDEIDSRWAEKRANWAREDAALEQLNKDGVA